ncbi:hypothetical protein PVAP13_4NG085317 [Panicum virgatum]|uniref:Uncharacterized protein n=1 Tax=Panicum virgatum TaxID=38727 RepID=A0A8T0TAX6_PANVG|nr:hypothetical protein PVAP13_4NG085317 [Panicum virgatum]KAG2605626.1 hypothetical protein PVAP13_4NG085317 [Panicum virgatum]KAG2605628.1 hypothetical protein PVAP13_4NG085317 [Panicum virgatum]
MAEHGRAEWSNRADPSAWMRAHPFGHRPLQRWLGGAVRVAWGRSLGVVAAGEGHDAEMQTARGQSAQQLGGLWRCRGRRGVRWRRGGGRRAGEEDGRGPGAGRGPPPCGSPAASQRRGPTTSSSGKCRSGR